MPTHRTTATGTSCPRPAVFVDFWDNYPGTPSGYRGLGYHAHVVHQNWDGSQYVTDNEWDATWGGSTNYVPIDPHYWKYTDICQNLTGYAVVG